MCYKAEIEGTDAVSTVLPSSPMQPWSPSKCLSPLLLSHECSVLKYQSGKCSSTPFLMDYFECTLFYFLLLKSLIDIAKIICMWNHFLTLIRFIFIFMWQDFCFGFMNTSRHHAILKHLKLSCHLMQHLFICVLDVQALAECGVLWGRRKPPPPFRPSRLQKLWSRVPFPSSLAPVSVWSAPDVVVFSFTYLSCFLFPTTLAYFCYCVRIASLFYVWISTCWHSWCIQPLNDLRSPRI